MVEEGFRCHYEAGRAIAALLGVVVDEGLNDGMLLLAGGAKRFERLDLASDGVDGEDGATVHHFAVDHDGAGSAGATVADALGGSEVEVVAQGIEQGFAGLDFGLHFGAVHVERDVDGSGAGGRRDRGGSFGLGQQRSAEDGCAGACALQESAAGEIGLLGAFRFRRRRG